MVTGPGSMQHAATGTDDGASSSRHLRVLRGSLKVPPCLVLTEGVVAVRHIEQSCRTAPATSSWLGTSTLTGFGQRALLDRSAACPKVPGGSSGLVEVPFWQVYSWKLMKIGA